MAVPAEVSTPTMITVKRKGHFILRSLLIFSQYYHVAIWTLQCWRCPFEKHLAIFFMNKGYPCHKLTCTILADECFQRKDFNSRSVHQSPLSWKSKRASGRGMGENRTRKRPFSLYRFSKATKVANLNPFRLNHTPFSLNAIIFLHISKNSETNISPFILFARLDAMPKLGNPLSPPFDVGTI